jgi:ATP-binding cassette subfamily C (CFTR/MRP) protein 1
MDNAITNIMGIIFGAVLYFFGRSLFLFLGNPISLALLPFIALGLEYYASFYRVTVRELQRIHLVSMGVVYQDMVEAVMGRVSVGAFASSRSVLSQSIAGLDAYQRAGFAKASVQFWLGLRMSLISYAISFFNTLYPLMQYYGWLAPQSAAIVGFTIIYSTETVAVLRQVILNYSDLEMQLISIERLREYAKADLALPAAVPPIVSRYGGVVSERGLDMVDVNVTYRAGLRPALSGVNLSFAPGEAIAVVGRTGAGKSSLLLSLLQFYWQPLCPC